MQHFQEFWDDGEFTWPPGIPEFLDPVIRFFVETFVNFSHKQEHSAKHFPQAFNPWKRIPFSRLKKNLNEWEYFTLKRMDHKNGMPNTITLPETSIAREIQWDEISFWNGSESKVFPYIHPKNKGEQKHLVVRFPHGLQLLVHRFDQFGRFHSTEATNVQDNVGPVFGHSCTITCYPPAIWLVVGCLLSFTKKTRRYRENTIKVISTNIEKCQVVFSSMFFQVIHPRNLARQWKTNIWRCVSYWKWGFSSQSC